MKGGEKVIFAIDSLAAMKVLKADQHKTKADFPASTFEKNYSFRDRLSEATASRSLNEGKNDDRIAPVRVMIGKAETKLKNIKDTNNDANQKSDSEDKVSGDQTDENKMTVEQMLKRLDELLGIMQQEGIPQEKQTMLIENIEAAIKAFSEAGPKTAELAAALEAQLSRLEANGGIIDSKLLEHFSSELKAMLVQDSAKTEAAMITTADLHKAGNIAEQGAGASNMTEAEAEVMKLSGTSEEISEGKAGNSAESRQINGTLVKKEKSAWSETAAQNKEAQPIAEENIDEAKAAIDSKIEKVSVSGKEAEKQDADAGHGREAESGLTKADGLVQQNQENPDIPVFKAELPIAENKLEMAAVRIEAKQVPVSKAEVINQIVKKAELILNDTTKEMRIQLEPENLGKLTLKLAVEKGLITAKFVAESYEVKQTLESSFNELKDMLREKGLEVQNFSVSVGQEKESGSNSFQQWKEASRLKARNLNQGLNIRYLDGDEAAFMEINPYSIHDGKFDHRA